MNHYVLTFLAMLCPGPVQNLHFLDFATAFGRFGDSISELFHVQIWGPMPSGFGWSGEGSRWGESWHGWGEIALEAHL